MALDTGKGLSSEEGLLLHVLRMDNPDRLKLCVACKMCRRILCACADLLLFYSRTNCSYIRLLPKAPTGLAHETAPGRFMPSKIGIS